MDEALIKKVQPHSPEAEDSSAASLPTAASVSGSSIPLQ